jgi:DNA polymerase-4
VSSPATAPARDSESAQQPALATQPPAAVPEGDAEAERTIAHIDVDAFYVSVELLRRPELRGKPVVVAGTGPRAVVTTASYEARSFGVGSAMPAARARRLCPEAIFLAPDFAHYKEVSRQLMAIVRACADQVEVMGLDEAYMDISGLQFPHAAMRRLVADIGRHTGLTCSVGIGPNKLVAKVASDAEKPAGFVVLTRRQACRRFTGAPPALLPGIGPKTAERLTALGLTTIGDLARAPESLLAERFGENSARSLARMARFHHDGAVTEVRAVVSASRERTFDRDVAGAQEMHQALAAMAQDLCSGLARQGRTGRTISIKVRLDDFSTVTRARTLPHATADGALVGRVASELLRQYAPARPVRLLGVRMAGFAESSNVVSGGTHEARHQAHRGPLAAADQLALPI